MTSHEETFTSSSTFPPSVSSSIVPKNQPHNTSFGGLPLEQAMEETSDEPPHTCPSSSSSSASTSASSVAAAAASSSATTKPETKSSSEEEEDEEEGPEVAVGPAVSWVTPKVEARTSKTGSGIFAVAPIKKNETLIVWTGKIVSAEQALEVMDTPDKHYLLQIADGFYQTPLFDYREPADWSNHSCNPNAGFGKSSPILLSSMREIAVGEEITFDYGMCETDSRLWEPMECLCETPYCRHWITANDWKLYPELWVRYEGYFAPHVQKKIDEYRATLSQEQKTVSHENSESNLADAVDTPTNVTTSEDSSENNSDSSASSTPNTLSPTTSPSIIANNNTPYMKQLNKVKRRKNSKNADKSLSNTHSRTNDVVVSSDEDVEELTLPSSSIIVANVQTTTNVHEHHTTLNNKNDTLSSQTVLTQLQHRKEDRVEVPTLEKNISLSSYSIANADINALNSNSTPTPINSSTAQPANIASTVVNNPKPVSVTDSTDPYYMQVYDKLLYKLFGVMRVKKLRDSRIQVEN